MALRDGPQVVLAAGAGDLHQVFVAEGVGVPQHGPGHLDLVGGQGAHQPGRRPAALGHALGEFGANRHLHLAGQLAQHIVEQGHFPGPVAVGGEEQVGNPAQQFAAAGAIGFAGQRDQVMQAAPGRQVTRH